jgi:hypothetical protein
MRSTQCVISGLCLFLGIHAEEVELASQCANGIGCEHRNLVHKRVTAGKENLDMVSNDEHEHAARKLDASQKHNTTEKHDLSLSTSLQQAMKTTVDLLTITEIKCVHPATGLSDVAHGLVSALGALVAAGATIAAGGAVVVGTGGAAIGTLPVTYAAIGKAAAAGASGAGSAMLFLDGQFSGQDDLIIKVNGKQKVPVSGKYRATDAGETFRPNIKASFRGAARISLIEYDSVSDNDDMGHIDVQGGSDYAMDKAIVMSQEEGSTYELSYTVEAGKGDPLSLVDWMLCGTNQCDACDRAKCKRQGFGNLDRDKDHEDLKDCPQCFQTHRYKEYHQTWPAANVFLRVCKRVSSSCA